MDALKRTRSCNRQPQASGEAVPRGSRQICIPMTRDIHDDVWIDAGKVRSYLTPLIQTMPVLEQPRLGVQLPAGVSIRVGVAGGATSI